MDKPMVDFMQANGFEVVHSEVVGFVASIDLGRVGPETAYELDGARTAGRGRDHHARRQLGIDAGRRTTGERAWQADPGEQRR